MKRVTMGAWHAQGARPTPASDSRRSREHDGKSWV